LTRRAALIVLDGLGVGTAHDTAEWGDSGSATLGNVMRANPGLHLPNLADLGLGLIGDSGIAAVSRPAAARGTAEPASPGKDSTTGHWELCGIILDRPFPTWPDGFPAELLERFSTATGRGILGNKAASGTAILDELGARHVETGHWIIYTSADSVFQVAAHEQVVPLEELYAACRTARELLTGRWGASRVIARPFTGKPGGWKRTTNRKDFSLAPPQGTLLDRLSHAHLPVIGVGKVDDLFAGRGVRAVHAGTNAEAFDLILRGLGALRRGLLFANVIEFDQTWGHRNDVAGFARGLAALDRWIPKLRSAIGEEDLVILTADHGNDPTTPSTDHSRERVPILVLGGKVNPVAIGNRSTFADVGQTVAEFLGVPPLPAGTSFLREVWSG
jgi:phosphopentomutase